MHDVGDVMTGGGWGFTLGRAAGLPGLWDDGGAEERPAARPHQRPRAYGQPRVGRPRAGVTHSSRLPP
eukprot:917283-Prorocentrum_minimum.AAC.1